MIRCWFGTGRPTRKGEEPVTGTQPDRSIGVDEVDTGTNWSRPQEPVVAVIVRASDGRWFRLALDPQAARSLGVRLLEAGDTILLETRRDGYDGAQDSPIRA